MLILNKSIFLIVTLMSLIIMMVSVINSQKPSILIEGTIFDQYPVYNQNFERTTPYSNVKSVGMVKSGINVTTRTPILSSFDTSTTPNKYGSLSRSDLFQYFFQSNPNALASDNSGKNYPKAFDIELKYNPDSGTYVFNYQEFFPLDNILFDTDPTFRKYKKSGTYHNFHFCLKMNSKFTYSGGEVFNFVGDDDVWVFIDDKLVVDLGGIHPPQTQNIALDDLGLTKTKVYNFDFFYCERHTDGSSIRIDTTILAYCAWYDYCGVCTGDGATCCSAKDNCDDSNPCTVDTCPPPQPTFPISELKDRCVHTPVKCPNIDQCTINQCSTEKNGACVQTKKECPDRSNECLKYDGCNPSTGCTYSPICTGACETGLCLGNGICQQKTNNTCSDTLGANKCKIFSCSVENGGCQSTDKCLSPDPDNKCIIPECNALTGECSSHKLDEKDCECDCDLNPCEINNCVGNPTKCEPLRKPDIDDGNLCTIDLCNNVTGVITHTPVECRGCMKCNPNNGNCEPVASICEDGNECTDNICQVSIENALQGICVNSTTNCDGTDICKVYTCDTETGCKTEDLVCPDSGNCLVGYCDKTKGCQLKPRECKSPAFCIVAECDQSIGCISYERRCASDNPKCQEGVCRNATETEDGECTSEDFDPQPFICKTAVVVSTAVVAGVVVAGAVALAAAIFGGKKGYDYWKESRNISMSSANANPLYEQSANAGVNPLYNDAGIN